MSASPSATLPQSAPSQTEQNTRQNDLFVSNVHKPPPLGPLNNASVQSCPSEGMMMTPASSRPLSPSSKATQNLNKYLKEKATSIVHSNGPNLNESPDSGPNHLALSIHPSHGQPDDLQTEPNAKSPPLTLSYSPSPPPSPSPSPACQAYYFADNHYELQILPDNQQESFIFKDNTTKDSFHLTKASTNKSIPLEEKYKSSHILENLWTNMPHLDQNQNIQIKKIILLYKADQIIFGMIIQIINKTQTQEPIFKSNIQGSSSSNSFECPINNCNEKPANMNNLRNHISNKHDSIINCNTPIPYSTGYIFCPICNKLINNNNPTSYQTHSRQITINNHNQEDIVKALSIMMSLLSYFNQLNEIEIISISTNCSSKNNIIDNNTNNNIDNNIDNNLIKKNYHQKEKIIN